MTDLPVLIALLIIAIFAGVVWVREWWREQVDFAEKYDEEDE